MKRLLLLACFMTVSPAWGMDKIAEVEHGTPDVIVHFPIWDFDDPKTCATVSETTDGLKIVVSSDVTNGPLATYECQGASCATTDTLQGITTFGTHSDPSANNARIAKKTNTVCEYELQLADSIYSTAGANQITIGVSCGGSNCIENEYWVDLTPVSVTTLLGTSCSGYTAGEVGYQLCTVMDAVLADTGTTLELRTAAMKTQLDALVPQSGSADSGDTTSLTDAELTQSANHWNGYWISVEYSGGTRYACVIGFDSTVLTLYPALPDINTETYSLINVGDCRHAYFP